MTILIGLLIIAVGSFGQSSSYVPINRIKDWSWECFWLVQGIFAWLVFPYLGALLAVPEGGSLFGIIGSAGGSVVLKTIGFGILWGIGGLTFGLSMRYLGVALGQSLALGTCSAFGTLIPPLLPQLFPAAEKMTTILIIGVSIAIAGIAVIGYAGALKSQNMSEEEKKKAVKDFALKKGLLIALLAGVMSACFALGLEAGKPLAVSGGNPLFETLPATLLVTIGGFITNAAYCLFQNIRNGSGKDYFSVPGATLLNNLLFCVLAGGLWYSQFFGLGMGKSYFSDSPVILAFSWSILMSLNVIFSNVWGIILKEWKGVSLQTIIVLSAGICLLIFSLLFPNLF
ncbi:MAG: L-rhamnose/proton symporter RhaT [Tannerellaceae bacterium]|jgi:L-rhamnose-H+ transport protein|nr:L-rhamnose/proton symporter RhaT [Tannerellaceae bacterium]